MTGRRQRVRRTAAVGAAAFVLAGSAALTTAGTASAAPPLVAGSCGATLQGEPGQPLTLNVSKALGLPGDLSLALGSVPAGTRTFSVPGSKLLGIVGNLPILGPALPKVCDVTVTGVNAAAAPVQDGAAAVGEAGRDAVGAVDGAVRGLTSGGNQPAPQQPGGNKPAPQQPAPQPGRPPGGIPEQQTGPVPGLAPPSSPLLGGANVPGFAALPTSFDTGFAPMRDYSNIPAAQAGLFAPSPGVRYGGQAPGYSPQFGVLGRQPDQQRAPENEDVRTSGRAEALPGAGGNPMSDAIGFPVLAAVLALSGVTAALVRTWVLRKAA